MSDTEQAGVSKSAKRRAAKKAREEANGGPKEQEPVPAKQGNKENVSNVKPKVEPKVEAAEPKAKAKAKAKAKPEQPKAEPKAEPKATAPKAKPEAKPAAKPAAKPTAKSAGKPKAEQKPVEEAKTVRKESDMKQFVEMDDGTGGDWELSTGLTKKAQKRKDREAQEKVEKAEAKAAGMGAPANQQRIPGMADLPAAPKAGSKAGVGKVAVAAGTAGAKDAEKKEEAVSTTVTLTVPVPEKKIGIVIGPKGANIKMIQEKTGAARIETSQDERGCFTITGTASAASQAKAAIEDLIDKGYTSLAYDNFSEAGIPVHPSRFPDLIGTGGSVIKELKKMLGVEVTIPETPKGADKAAKKYKVTLAGTPEKVEQAKKVIDDLLMYYHSEVTHPGQAHEELEIKFGDNSLRYIIGKGGSELKHIQNNFKVRLNIPRENSANQNVVIVGEPNDVERAKAYIERVIYNAGQPRGRDRPDDVDVWGEEGEDEEWMKQYIYKYKH